MFVVKIKQDSSRHMVGNFTSLCMEELTAGSARIFYTDIIHRGSHPASRCSSAFVGLIRWLFCWLPLREITERL